MLLNVTLRVLAVACLMIPLAAAQDRFDTTVILISIDGMRADYLEKHAPPELARLAKEGVRAKWMIPAYPTKTFPNHYTVATGLYPGNHGLIENNMWDAATGKTFGLGDRSAVEDPMWWGGQPIWVTAQNQGHIAGAFFFPGTETLIQGVRPRYYKPYDGKVAIEERVDTVLSWFDLPRNERPVMITLYFSDVDDAGHAFGPDADETRDALHRVDRVIERLMTGLRQRGAHRAANVIFISDHGMAHTRRGMRSCSTGCLMRMMQRRCSGWASLLRSFRSLVWRIEFTNPSDLSSRQPHGSTGGRISPLDSN